MAMYTVNWLKLMDLIKVEINSYWRNTGAEGWKCTDQNFCEMIFLCLQGLIDKHITQKTYSV